MNLTLSLIVMGASLAGLVLLLKPSATSRNKRTRVAKPKPPPSLASNSKPPALPQPPVAKEPSMEDMRTAVRSYSTQFPEQTAILLKSWANRKN